MISALSLWNKVLCLYNEKNKIKNSFLNFYQSSNSILPITFYIDLSTPWHYFHTQHSTSCKHTHCFTNHDSLSLSLHSLPTNDGATSTDFPGEDSDEIIDEVQVRM